MKFRTELEMEMSGVILDPRRPVVLVGSCFAENIAARMNACLWKGINPLGNLYNPLSIARSLRMALKTASTVEEIDVQEEYSPGELPDEFRESLFESEGMWHTWLADSRMSGATPEDVCTAFASASSELRQALLEAQALFVTFGTARAYFLEGEDNPVANCHKRPARIFTRRRLEISEIVDEWRRLVEELRGDFPNLEVIFTVSPVRHVKDGLVENARSKSVLILAIDELCRMVERCSYFPAFELLNDDLRDYRFYASDLVHPSAEGVEYIWEKFRASFIDPAGEARLKEGESIRKGLDHRPLKTATRHQSEEMAAREEERLAALRRRLDLFLGL